MIVRGNPYVSIIADHSEPGKIVKYAPNPYLEKRIAISYEHQNACFAINEITYERRLPPTAKPITPKETYWKRVKDSIKIKNEVLEKESEFKGYHPEV